MSLALSLLGPDAPAATRRGRGRPPVDSDPEQVGLHLMVAKARVLYRVPVADVCSTFDVSERTVRYWVNRALTYPGPTADVLRRAHAHALAN